MTFLEFFDRWLERRARNPRPQRDIRQFIGAMFLVGYYVMVWQFSRSALPQENIDLVRDAMLTLGPPIGIIIGAMFRSDAKDEQATRNTGGAFRAIEATAKAAEKAVEHGPSGTPEDPLHTTANEPQEVHVVNPLNQPVPTVEGKKK